MWAKGATVALISIALAAALCSCAQSTSGMSNAVTSTVIKAVAALFDNTSFLQSGLEGGSGGTATEDDSASDSGLQGQPYDPQAAEAMSSWVGRYIWDEAWPINGSPDSNNVMSYEMVIFSFGEQDYYADIQVLGFQTWDRYVARVEGNDKSVTLVFDAYFGVDVKRLYPLGLLTKYTQGDELFQLDRDGTGLVTTWDKLKPVLEEHEAPGNYFVKY